MNLKVGDMVGRYRKESSEVGQAMVEWAFVFPVFLLLVFGIIDFSWLGYQRLMFESSFQMTAWDFTLFLKDPRIGVGRLSDRDIILYEIKPDDYNESSPDVVIVNGSYYALGEGIKKHMLESSVGFLEADKLTVTSATAVFGINQLEDYYNITGSEYVMVESSQLQVSLAADLEYRIKFLTPVGRIFDPSGEVILEKKLVRERTERVVIKRRVEVPAPP